MAANLVWSMPQVTLGTAAIQHNLLPQVFGGGPDSVFQGMTAKVIAVLIFLAISIAASLFYSAGGRGVKIFEFIIKGMVSIIVLCFLGVIIRLSFVEGGIDWSEVLHGLIPDPRMLFKPTASLTPYLQAVADHGRQFWTDLIVAQQRDVMISAIAATVGINMTFLFPYSMLRRGWDKDFRGLAIFDLSTGLFIPFALASGFVVMAAASQFHAKPAPGFVGQEEGEIVTVAPAANLVGPYNALLEKRIAFEIGAEAYGKLSPEARKQAVDAMPYADRRMAAILVKRDNFNLADTLTPLTGKGVAQYVFGLGVVGLGLSAATMLMAINGLCLCVMFNKTPGGWTQRVGALLVSVGAIGAIFWKQPAPWIAIATSSFCSVLLPIAYFTFLLLMNNRSLLGDSLPRGGVRVFWNVLMVLATFMASFVGLWSLWPRSGAWSLVLIGAFIALSLIVHVIRMGKAKAGAAAARA